MHEIFGLQLALVTDDAFHTLPSPEALKMKVIVRTHKAWGIPVDLAGTTQVIVFDDSDLTPGRAARKGSHEALSVKESILAHLHRRDFDPHMEGIHDCTDGCRNNKR